MQQKVYKLVGLVLVSLLSHFQSLSDLAVFVILGDLGLFFYCEVLVLELCSSSLKAYHIEKNIRLMQEVLKLG